MTTLRARQLLASRNITIPSLPAVVVKVQKMLEDPNTGAKEVGDVVASDAPIAAKVLKIANSAYYGLRERCMMPQHASAILGVRVLRNVVTQAAVISKYDHLKDSGFDMTGQWKHSILVAQSCNQLGRKCKARVGLTPDELYVCGLLHDLGKVVLLDCLRQDYVDVVKFAKERSMPLFAAEQERLGFAHTDVGQIVAQQWGLPPQIEHAIHNHHAGREVLESDPIVALVAGVNQMVHRVTDGNLSAAATTFDARTVKLLGIAPTDVNDLVEFADKAKNSIVV